MGRECAEFFLMGSHNFQRGQIGDYSSPTIAGGGGWGDYRKLTAAWGGRGVLLESPTPTPTPIRKIMTAPLIPLAINQRKIFSTVILN